MLGRFSYKKILQQEAKRMDWALICPIVCDRSLYGITQDGCSSLWKSPFSKAWLQPPHHFPPLATTHKRRHLLTQTVPILKNSSHESHLQKSFIFLLQVRLFLFQPHLRLLALLKQREQTSRLAYSTTRLSRHGKKI